MNPEDFSELMFPFLHLTSDVSTFNHLRLVNKRFNCEFKDSNIIIFLDKWFKRSADQYFWKSSSTKFKKYSHKNNIFQFQIEFRRYNDFAFHDVVFTIINGKGSLTMDSGNLKNLECDDDDDSDEEFDDESSEFYDRTIRTFQNILSLDDLKKNLNKVIRNVNYY